jgi:hypothetical protein
MSPFHASRRVSICAGLYFFVFDHVFSGLSSSSIVFLLLQVVDSGVNLLARGLTSFTVWHLELPHFLFTVAFTGASKVTRLSFRTSGGLLPVRAYLANVSSSISPCSRYYIPLPYNPGVLSCSSSSNAPSNPSFFIFTAVLSFPAHYVQINPRVIACQRLPSPISHQKWCCHWCHPNL